MSDKPLVAVQDQDGALTSLGTHTRCDGVVTLFRPWSSSAKKRLRCYKAEAVYDAVIKEKSEEASV